jgi:hypothetical protein
MTTVAVAHGDIEAARGERSCEEYAPRALADVDEAACAREPRSETAHVDVAVAVDLRHAEARHVEPAAVVEVELLVLMDDGLGVDGSAEVEPALRKSADDAGLRGQRDVSQHLLFVGDRGDTFGHADAEVHDAAHRQVECAPACDHLALVERQREGARRAPP